MMIAGNDHPGSPGPQVEIRRQRIQIKDLELRVKELELTNRRLHELNQELRQERDDALAREQTAAEKRGKKHG